MFALVKLGYLIIWRKLLGLLWSILIVLKLVLMEARVPRVIC